MSTDPYIHQRNVLNRQGREFLYNILADGPQPYMVIVARATEAGISPATLMTAKVALKVESHKVNNRAVWQLPRPSTA